MILSGESLDPMSSDIRALTLRRYLGRSSEYEVPRMAAPDGEGPLRTVTRISDGAFAGNECIVSVFVPGTVRAIGDRAFRDCGYLRTVELGVGLEAIGAGSFQGCASLSEIEVPVSVRAIGEGAFDRSTTVVGSAAAGSGAPEGDPIGRFLGSLEPCEYDYLKDLCLGRDPQGALEKYGKRERPVRNQINSRFIDAFGEDDGLIDTDGGVSEDHLGKLIDHFRDDASSDPESIGTCGESANAARAADAKAAGDRDTPHPGTSMEEASQWQIPFAGNDGERGAQAELDARIIAKPLEESRERLVNGGVPDLGCGMSLKVDEIWDAWGREARELIDRDPEKVRETYLALTGQHVSKEDHEKTLEWLRSRGYDVPKDEGEAAYIIADSLGGYSRAVEQAARDNRADAAREAVRSVMENAAGRFRISSDELWDLAKLYTDAVGAKTIAETNPRIGDRDKAVSEANERLADLLDRYGISGGDDMEQFRDAMRFTNSIKGLLDNSKKESDELGGDENYVYERLLHNILKQASRSAKYLMDTSTYLEHSKDADEATKEASRKYTKGKDQVVRSALNKLKLFSGSGTTFGEDMGRLYEQLNPLRESRMAGNPPPERLDLDLGTIDPGGYDDEGRYIPGADLKDFQQQRRRREDDPAPTNPGHRTSVYFPHSNAWTPILNPALYAEEQKRIAEEAARNKLSAEERRNAIWELTQPDMRDYLERKGGAKGGSTEPAAPSASERTLAPFPDGADGPKPHPGLHPSLSSMEPDLKDRRAASNGGAVPRSEGKAVGYGDVTDPVVTRPKRGAGVSATEPPEDDASPDASVDRGATHSETHREGTHMPESRKTSMPSKKVAYKILSAYRGGVSNMEGVEYTAFGRETEVARFDQTLKMTKEGSGRMEALVGPYGIGKSFILALFQGLATKKGFVVMSADITASKWFAGTVSEKQGLNLYRDLIKSTAVKGCNQDAFDLILEQWYEDLKEETGGGLSEIAEEFNRRTRDCWSLTQYNDIRAAILARFREFENDDPSPLSQDFFLANLTKKTDAQAIGAKDYIRDPRWFEIMNTYSHLFVHAGYKGLILLFDQTDALLNLPRINRQQNYEALLAMWNSINEGRTEHLSAVLFAADSLIDDPKRGTILYKALDDRIKGATRLQVLPNEYMVALLERLREIHEYVNTWESGISDEETRRFAEAMLSNAGMGRSCIRPVCVAWVKRLDDELAGRDEPEDVYIEVAKRESEEAVDDGALPERFPEDRDGDR